MGKFLIVKGANFAANGMPFDQPTPEPGTEDFMPTFQSNALPLGTSLTYNGGTNVGTTSSTTRIACNKTTVVSSKTYLKIKLKDGFQIALLAISPSNTAYTTNADGTLTSKATWDWATVNTFSIPLAQMTTFAFNIRYSDNSTQFTSNDISQALDYIRAED